jgi:AraC-like DNA-binding protein
MKTDVKSCSLTGPTRTKAPSAETAPQRPSGHQATASKRVAEAKPSELLAFKEYQDLFRTRLTGPVRKLIAQLTGLRLRVLWHRPLDFQGHGEMPVLCPSARQRMGAKARRSRGCESCLRRRWKLALSPSSQGRRFVGQCGTTNFCACLQVDSICPLTLVLQARLTHHAPHSTLRTTSPAAFRRAMALARLILHDLESATQARMARRELVNALRRLNHTQSEAARLSGGQRPRLPGGSETAIPPDSGRRSRKLVETMLDYVRQRYQRPIRLGDVASAMQMNASYLSTLFSQTTGVTFHQFLAELRLSKARELLRDPRNRVSEVACASGYASPDAFRHAFKAREGLSPDAWRAGQ